jgi:hypothetical protein
MPVCENCAVLGHYTVSSGNLLLKFRDSLTVPFLNGTPVINYHFSLCSDPDERSSQVLRGGSLKSPLYVRYTAVSI